MSTRPDVNDTEISTASDAGPAAPSPRRPQDEPPARPEPTAARSEEPAVHPELLPVAAGRRTRAAALELLRPDRARAIRAGLVLVAATAVGLLTQPLLGRVVDLVADGGAAGALTLPWCCWPPSRSYRAGRPRWGWGWSPSSASPYWPGCASASSSERCPSPPTGWSAPEPGT